jgi:hypothetical protein
VCQGFAPAPIVAPQRCAARKVASGLGLRMVSDPRFEAAITRRAVLGAALLSPVVLGQVRPIPRASDVDFILRDVAIGVVFSLPGIADASAESGHALC